jgi:hypothetical protein
VPVRVAFGGLAGSGLRSVWLLLFSVPVGLCSCAFFRLCCVLCRPLLLGWLSSLCAPLGFLLTLLPHPSFPFRASL